MKTEERDIIEQLWQAERRGEIETKLRQELETAWLRGNAAGERRSGASSYGSPKANQEVLREAADYAERVMGGSTRPAKPDPLPTPSKDENAA